MLRGEKSARRVAVPLQALAVPLGVNLVIFRHFPHVAEMPTMIMAVTLFSTAEKTTVIRP